MTDSSNFDFATDLDIILDEMSALLLAKNSDYSGDTANNPFANFEFTANAIGVYPKDSIFYEISKKYKRAENLLRSPQSAVKDESFEDAVRDIIGGSLLMLLYLRYERQNKQTETQGS